MAETKDWTIKVKVPVGWKPKGEYPLKRPVPGERYLESPTRILTANAGCYSVLLVVEPDSAFIDTTAEEYQLEVFRQCELRRKTREYRFIDSEGNTAWGTAPNHVWEWGKVLYRVKPEGMDDHGLYYLNNGQKVYVPT